MRPALPWLLFIMSIGPPLEWGSVFSLSLLVGGVLSPLCQEHHIWPPLSWVMALSLLSFFWGDERRRIMSTKPSPAVRWWRFCQKQVRKHRDPSFWVVALSLLCVVSGNGASVWSPQWNCHWRRDGSYAWITEQRASRAASRAGQCRAKQRAESHRGPACRSFVRVLNGVGVRCSGVESRLCWLRKNHPKQDTTTEPSQCDPSPSRCQRTTDDHTPQIHDGQQVDGDGL